MSDRDPQPLVRIPPIMPTRAEKSGHCRIRFDVIPEERPLMWPRSFTLKACLRDDYQIGADIEI